VSGDVVAGLVGGTLGSAVGLLGSYFGSGLGPKKLDDHREDKLERKEYGPRKAVLARMLSDERWTIRYLDTLCLYTGHLPKNAVGSWSRSRPAAS
jgi:hypothetical protein